MTKAMWGLLGVVLSTGVALAQPKPPTPTPTPAAAPGDKPAPTPAPGDKPAPSPSSGEKAGGDETLQKGGDNRPWAAGISIERQKQALVEFREGNAQLNDGLFARAAETYHKALTTWPHPAIHYNLALAQMNLDQPIEAYENFQNAIVYGEAPLAKDKLEHAKDYMLLLEKQIARVEVSCDKPGAKISVDGKEVFVAPGRYTARVRIGRHTFVADKKGYQTRIGAPFIGPGETYRIELKLYTAEELTRYNRRWQTKWMPYAVLGAGVAIGLGGVVLELSAGATYNDYDKKVVACNMNNLGCPTTNELTSIRESGDTKKTLGYVAYGVAGGTIAAGVLLAILNRPKAYQIRPEDLQQEEDARRPRVSVSPIVTPIMAGAMVHGTF
jgi:tetratricopeptide (TPR) repeat protein